MQPTGRARGAKGANADQIWFKSGTPFYADVVTLVMHALTPDGRLKIMDFGIALLRSLQIDLVAEVVVRNLAFRAGHRCGNGAPHLGHVGGRDFAPRWRFGMDEARLQGEVAVDGPPQAGERLAELLAAHETPEETLGSLAARPPPEARSSASSARPVRPPPDALRTAVTAAAPTVLTCL